MPILSHPYTLLGLLASYLGDQQSNQLMSGPSDEPSRGSWILGQNFSALSWLHSKAILFSVIFLYSLTNNKASRCSSAWQSSDIRFQLFHIPALNLFLRAWFALLENCWKTTALGLLVSTFCAASCIVDKPAWKSLLSSALCPILQHTI